MFKTCQLCAACCQNIILPLERIFDKDIIRWIEYHNLEVIEEGGRQCVKISNPCSKLKDNRCSIYEDRPENCKLFKCKKYETI
jgi:Fe-S-cluster containining protein